MGWARIDDAFDDHEKVLALLDLDEGVAAVGLWALCLTWAHRNTRKKGKVPGLLPSTLPRRFVGARGRELAEMLVDAGMWDVVDDGWMIHDFADYLPDKEVSAARSAAGKKGAASRWGNRRADGKLPSSDSKTDGNPVAADAPAIADSRLNSQPSGETTAPSPPDGNEPSSDGNLLSLSHRSDDKAVASDGSRAGARRVRVDVGTTVLIPVPDPEPVPPSAAEPPARRDPIDDVDGLTLTQRSKRITDAYAAAEPLCKWPAVNAIALKAIKASRWADSEIRDALLRMAADGRTVTVDSLRIELQGMPSRSLPMPPAQTRNAKIINAAMERAIAAEQRMNQHTSPPKGAIAQ